jgi:phosphoribosylanthranilate isomerase
MRPRVKICGITRAEDADAALHLGAELLGLNFYSPSPRHIDVAAAARLRRHIGDRAQVVGVFVNHASDEVARIDREVGLDLLQFHGDEGADEIEPWADRAIKVFRVRGELPQDDLARYPRTWGLLFDSAKAGATGAAAYGGSGASWSWDAAGGLPVHRRVLIAGGIRPDNVVELLARLSPWGIDVSSGVESAPGRKDPFLMERLFEEIAHAQIGAP